MSHMTKYLIGALATISLLIGGTYYILNDANPAPKYTALSLDKSSGQSVQKTAQKEATSSTALNIASSDIDLQSSIEDLEKSIKDIDSADSDLTKLLSNL